jgi:transposase-like protein
MPPTPAHGSIDLYCPRCRSVEAVPHSFGRSSSVYLCRDCEYQWEGEPPETSSPPALERDRHDARS